MSNGDSKRESAYIKFVGGINEINVSVVLDKHRRRGAEFLRMYNLGQTAEKRQKLDGTAGTYWGGLGQKQVEAINSSPRK